MQQVRVPVIKAFTHEGKPVRIGQTIGVSPVQAAILARRGYVSLTKTDEPESRRRYRRRDLVATEP